MSSFQFRPLAVACAALALGAGAAHADTFLQTYEAPGVLNTTSSIAGGVETFDSIALGSSGFVTNYGGSAFTGTYSAGAQVAVPDQYGAAAGVGHYVVTFASTGYAITLNQQANYFGYWLSALDAGNADALAGLVSSSTGPDTIYRGVVVQIGVDSQAINRRSDIQSTMTEDIDSVRSSQSGVNLDEEMASLLSFQRAYEAASKVVSVVDSTLDTLINRLGI